MLKKRKRMAFLAINVIIALIGMQSAFCQDNMNYLVVSSRLSNFNMNSISTLESQEVQTNAFDITVKSKSDFFVYALISYYYSSTGYVLPPGMMSIRLNTVVPSRPANFNEIPISGGNQLIIMGARTHPGTVKYTYNMNVGPIGFDVPPGTFNATVLFTMSQQ
jgi:hypothetical protein